MQNYSTLSDEVLLKLIEQDDFLAFEEIYHRYANGLVGFIQSKLGDVEESKDLVQEIFVTIWTDRKNIVVIQSISGYLYKIALNKSLNVFKRNKIKATYIKSFSEFLENSPERTDYLATEIEREQALSKVLKYLPERMRTIFELRYFEGLSNEQVAKRLSISQHTVATQMKRALKSIRQSLDVLAFIVILFNL